MPNVVSGRDEATDGALKCIPLPPPIVCRQILRCPILFVLHVVGASLRRLYFNWRNPWTSLTSHLQMEDPADDPRDFAHSGNVDFGEDGLPPGIDAFLRADSPGSCADYLLNYCCSHLAEFNGSWNSRQNTSDSPFQP